MADTTSTHHWLKRWLAPAAVGAAVYACCLAESSAQDCNPTGYCTYCENAHTADLANKDREDDWGVFDLLSDHHEEYHRHRRDHRRHLYYKAQNAHYELFYPQCPPDWSATFGYHVTQWRPFPGACEWRYPVMSSGATPAPLFTVPMNPTPVPPADAAPAEPEGVEPYFPAPAPATPDASPPPPPREETTEESASNAGVQILLMSGETVRPVTSLRLPPPKLYVPAAAFHDAETSPGGWLPSIVR